MRSLKCCWTGRFGEPYGLALIFIGLEGQGSGWGGMVVLNRGGLGNFGGVEV